MQYTYQSLIEVRCHPFIYPLGIYIVTKITAYQKSSRVFCNLREYYQRIREPETTTAADR